jgi:hypothetical protein
MPILAETSTASSASTPPRHPHRCCRLPGGWDPHPDHHLHHHPGDRQLLDVAWPRSPAGRLWAREGVGSDGAGLGAFLHGHGERSWRPAIQAAGRRTGAKTDAIDAVRAAGEALGHEHLALPRHRGDREALRYCWAGAATLSPHGLWRSTSSRR